MPDKILPPGVSIVSASDVQMMKVKVEGGFRTREDAQRIVDANKPFYAGEIRQAVTSGVQGIPDGTYEFEIWKPATRMQIDQLALAKRGDLIRFMVAWQIPEGASAVYGSEFVTGVVTGRAGNMLRAKVYSRPEKTFVHTLTYGDELTVSESQVITHETSTAQIAKEVEPFLTGVMPEVVPVNAEDAKLRQITQNLSPLQPEVGRRYWLRNGTVVRVWAHQVQKLAQCSLCRQQLLGSDNNWPCAVGGASGHNWVSVDRAVFLGSEQIPMEGGAWSDGGVIEWQTNGSHAGGLKDLDIVKDPQANEVVA